MLCQKRLEVFALQPSLKNSGGIRGLWSPEVPSSSVRWQRGLGVVWEGASKFRIPKCFSRLTGMTGFQHKYDQTLSIKAPTRDDTRSPLLPGKLMFSLIISLHFCAIALSRSAICLLLVVEPFIKSFGELNLGYETSLTVSVMICKGWRCLALFHIHPSYFFKQKFMYWMTIWTSIINNVQNLEQHKIMRILKNAK